MANRNFHLMKGSLDRGLVFMSGVISINASAAVTGETIVGASVAKTGTGQYTITLEDAYNECKAVQLQLGAATAVDLVPQVVSVDVASAKTVVFKLLAGSTATDPAAACNVQVLLVLKNSSVTP